MLTSSQTDLLRPAFREMGPRRKTASHAVLEQIAANTGVPLRMVEYFALQQGTIPKRYTRSIGTLGADGQCRLLAARVAVVGLGGLGGYVVETLARLGVGGIIGIDDDAFSDNNLNRQLCSRVANLGESKAKATAQRVRQVNPAVTFDAREARFEALADDVFDQCDLVFDCLDSFPARRALAKRCAAAGVTLVHGAIGGWCGQVGVCLPGSDLVDKVCGKKKRGAEKRLGNLPFTAAVAANLMAAKAVPLLTRQARPPPGNEILFFDLLQDDWMPISLWD